MRTIFKKAFILAASLAAASASAQLSSGPMAGDFVFIDDAGHAHALTDGDEVIYQGKRYRVPYEVNFIPKGGDPSKGTPNEPPVSFGGQNGHLVRRHTLTVGVYPYTIFSVAGSITNPADGSLTGGTRSVTGSTIALDQRIQLRGIRSLEIGGFYFRTFDNDADLYQLAARYFPSPRFGVQVAYLDSSMRDARTVTYHLIFRSESLTGGATGKQLAMELGIGLLNNLTNDYNVQTGAQIGRASVNFSTFVEVSYDLGKNIRLIASDWFIRDRSNDVNRFGFGIATKF